MFKEKMEFEDLVAIYKIYTKALFSAKSNIEKAYSYGNRSSVFFKIGLYKSCLTDINLAIKHEYPKTKQYRLYNRKAESFLMLKDFEKAAMSFSDALLNLCENDPSAFSWKKRIENGLKLCQLKDYSKELQFPITLSLNYPTALKTIDSSDQVLSMSNKVYLEVNKEDGRGIFASSNIAIGDVLTVEDPFSRRLARDCFLTHCYFCLKHNFNLIPCDGCCTVGFCNDECQSKANSQLRHDLECCILTEILSTNSGEIGLLAYGTICQTSLNTIRLALDQIGNHDDNSNNRTIDSQSYLSAITIETNEHLRTPEDVFDRCASSLFLAHCFVKMMSNHEKLDVTNDLLKTIYQAFCKHLQGLPCNAHSLSETTIPIGGSLELSSVNYIGNALYPALSMINHSCSPNVVRITMGNGQCVLKAVCPIKTGEQLFDNYSLHFATNSLKVRNEKLKDQYYFDCRCIACTENWPTFENQLLTANEPQLICPNCQMQMEPSTLVCTGCNYSIHDKYQQFVELKSSLSINMECLLKGQYDKVEKYLLQFCPLLHEIIKPPHILFNQTSEMLKLIWSIDGCHVSYS